MNLAEMLSYADIQDLSRIADNYRCSCNGHSKNELIQSILATVGRREVFEQEIKAMSMAELRFLNSLLFDPRTTFSLEELAARVQQSKFDAGEREAQEGPRETIVRFKNKGWLFNGHSQHTRYLFAVPADLKRRFIQALGKQFRLQLQTAGEPPVYRDEQLLIIDDIHSFLRQLSSQEMMLAADNTMYKRSLQSILEQLAVREEPVGKTAWRFGYGRMFRDYPNRFSFIYDYCFYNDLVSERNQVLALTELGKTRVDSRQKEELQHVYRFWLRLYKGAIPNLPSLVHWMHDLAKEWTTVASLAQILCPLIKPFYYDSAESILEQRIVRMMMHLGLLRVGEDETLGMVVQMTKLGSRIVEGVYIAEEDQIQLEV